MQGVHTGVWCQLALLGAVGGAGASGFQKCATGIAVVALLGLSGVGCVNEDENLDVHLTFASIYFGGAVGSGGTETHLPIYLYQQVCETHFYKHSLMLH